MKINLELSGLKIGVDNSITEAIHSKEWGVRLTFVDDNNTSRFETVINTKHIPSLIEKLQEVLIESEKLKT